MFIETSNKTVKLQMDKQQTKFWWQKLILELALLGSYHIPCWDCIQILNLEIWAKLIETSNKTGKLCESKDDKIAANAVLWQKQILILLHWNDLTQTLIFAKFHMIAN